MYCLLCFKTLKRSFFVQFRMRNKELDFALSKGGRKHRQVMTYGLKWKERVFRRERMKLAINGLDGRDFQIRSLSERFSLRSAFAGPLSPLFIPIFNLYTFRGLSRGDLLFRMSGCELFPQKRDTIRGVREPLSGFSLSFPERFRDAEKCPAFLLTRRCLDRNLIRFF